MPAPVVDTVDVTVDMAFYVVYLPLVVKGSAP
jgi:hypothetical protein